MQTTTPEEVGFSSDRLKRVSKLAKGYVDGGQLAGTVTMLSRSGKTFHHEATGVLDFDSGAPMQPDTIFRFHSMTKPITSVAVMMLYEEGLFHLDEPVSRLIPELGDRKVRAGIGQTGPTFVSEERPISIRHLLTHTAGLTNGQYEDSPVESMYRDADLRSPEGNLKDFVSKLRELPLVSQPGTKWRYSVATDVLGRLVEVLSDQSFDDFLQSKVLGPLGMKDTAFYVPEEKLDRLASVYGPGNGIKKLDNADVNSYRRPKSFLSGGGGLVSTGPDYMRFCQMLLNGGGLDGVSILGRKTVELMTKNHLADELRPFSVNGSSADESKGCGFGLGFKVIMDQAQYGILGSEGSYSWGGAASTFFWIDPLEDLIAIWLTQFMPISHPQRKEFEIATYQAMVE